MECKIDYKNCFIKSADCGPCMFRNFLGVFRSKDLNDNIQCGKSSVKENLLIKSRTTEKPSGDHLIKEKFPGWSFPMFGNLCSKHRSTEIEGKPQLVEFEEDHNDDLDFVCNTSLDDSCMSSLHSLLENTTGVMSPVKYWIAKPVGRTSRSKYVVPYRKYKEYMERSKQSYLTLLAPGQEERASMLFSDSDEEIENIPDDLKLSLICNTC